ncbi:MAG: hypothetical protein ACKVY0_14080 [Prosthecobacter sp.]|uniref:GAP1-N2 domain-containing protein n=1 Tax=Prosthecobacter sp. TaxID=1965333 RepID=UPI0038FEDE05
MAWQLIYTSAPRLLEAGRTGFGTVARHRAVSGLLATTVERFSQFARLPGHDPKRVVHNHRILAVGSGQFHVLSCLRDAGSDYTGRTNHIAHHLIVEAREIRPLVAAGITPADVLLAMSWYTSWNDRPRFFDPSDEIDLTTMRAQPSHAWEQVTGARDNSRLPWSSTAQRGCYLIIPPGTDARILFRESLQEMPAQAWQTTFTTSLEPNDDVADFRWIGLSPNSPLRALTETSARPVFDLLQPSKLPAPPPPQSNNVTAKTVHVPATPSVNVSAAQQIQNPPHQIPDAQVAQNICSSQLGDGMRSQRLSEPASALQQSGKYLLMLGMVAVVAAILLHQVKQGQKNQDVVKLEQRIDDAWKKYHLKLEDTKRWLQQEAREPTNLETASGLISSHEECLKQIHQSLKKPQLDQIAATPDRTRDDFSEMLNAHAEWLKKHSLIKIPQDWRPQSPSHMRLMMERWDEEKAAWRRFAYCFTQEPAVDKSHPRLLVQGALDTLNANAQPAGTAKEWRELLADLGETARPEWLDDWTKFESLGGNAPFGSIQLIVAQLKKKPNAPGWLKAMVQSKEMAMVAQAENQKSENAPAPAPVSKAPAENPDSPEAVNPIYLLALQEGETLSAALARLPELPVQPGMTLQSGSIASRAEDLGEPWKLLGSSFRQSVSSNDKIQFEGGRLTQVAGSNDGCRIIAYSEDGQRVLFDLRISTKSSQTRELLTLNKLPELQFHHSANEVRLAGMNRIIGRLHLAEAPAPRFQLRFEGTSGATAEQKLYAITAGKEDTYVVTTPAPQANDAALEIKRLQTSETELNDGIKKDREFITALNPRMAGREKKEAELRTSIAEKEIKLAGIAGQLEALQRQEPAMVNPPSGTYTLLEMTGTAKSLCRVQITKSQIPFSGTSIP